MGLSCGIVGLPNVGKSTLFNALTEADIEASNYPFCTIDPNVGVVTVPDDRLDKITQLITPQKTIPTAIEFVDIAGLVKGASQGEGLGNQFLGNIRQTDAVLHIVRCFENSDIVHVSGKLDPLDDIEVIETELGLADLASAQKAVEKAQKQAKSGDKIWKARAVFLEKMVSHLGDGLPARTCAIDESEQPFLKEIQFLTAKPMIYVCNVSEGDLPEGNALVDKVRAHAQTCGAGVVVVSAQVEAEIVQLDAQERKVFLEELGLSRSGLDIMIQESYKLLDLVTYFTAGEKEVRAWTIQKGTKAPQAAGVIHTDFEKGFIRAEVYHCDDLFEHKSEAELKNKGLLRSEGKDYVFKDGDVAHFRFNV